MGYAVALKIRIFKSAVQESKERNIEKESSGSTHQHVTTDRHGLGDWLLPSEFVAFCLDDRDLCWRLGRLADGSNTGADAHTNSGAVDASESDCHKDKESAEFAEEGREGSCCSCHELDTRSLLGHRQPTT
jgi:hypothetical protein